MVNPGNIIWLAMTFIVVFPTKRSSIRVRLAGKCHVITQMLIMSIRKEQTRSIPVVPKGENIGVNYDVVSLAKY